MVVSKFPSMLSSSVQKGDICVYMSPFTEDYRVKPVRLVPGDILFEQGVYSLLFMYVCFFSKGIHLILSFSVYMLFIVYNILSTSF